MSNTAPCVIADSSFYICFLDDITCPALLNLILEGPFQFLITRIVHDEIKASKNYLQIQTGRLKKLEAPQGPLVASEQGVRLRQKESQVRPRCFPRKSNHVNFLVSSTADCWMQEPCRQDPTRLQRQFENKAVGHRKPCPARPAVALVRRRLP